MFNNIFKTCTYTLVGCLVFYLYYKHTYIHNYNFNINLDYEAYFSKKNTISAILNEHKNFSMADDISKAKCERCGVPFRYSSMYHDGVAFKNFASKTSYQCYVFSKNYSIACYNDFTSPAYWKQKYDDMLTLHQMIDGSREYFTRFFLWMHRENDYMKAWRMAHEYDIFLDNLDFTLMGWYHFYFWFVSFAALIRLWGGIV